MTITELIDHLSQFPGDLPVFVEGYETGLAEVLLKVHR